jgi:hypothetical protein
LAVQFNQKVNFIDYFETRILLAILDFRFNIGFDLGTFAGSIANLAIR